MEKSHELAEKFIAGLGSVYYVSPNHISEVGGAEKYIPYLGTHISIPQEFVKTQGGMDKYHPGLGRDYFIHPDHVKGHRAFIEVDLPYTTITVTNEDTGYKKSSLASSCAGLVPGTYKYSVYKSGYATVTGEFIITADDTEEKVITVNLITPEE